MSSKSGKTIKSTKDKKSFQKNIKAKSGSKTIKKTIQKKKTKSSENNHVCEYSFSIIKDNNFRLQSQRVFFTYKNHIPFDKLYNFLNGLFPISQYIICHEDGDEQHPYHHTHISVEFQKK